MTSDQLTTAALAAALDGQDDPSVVDLMQAASAKLPPAGVVGFHVARLVDERASEPTWTRGLSDYATRSRLVSPAYLLAHREILASRARAYIDADDELNRAAVGWLAGADGSALTQAASAAVESMGRAGALWSPSQAATAARSVAAVLSGAWWSIYAEPVVEAMAPARLGRGRQSAPAVAELGRRAQVGRALLDTGLWTRRAVADALAVTRPTVQGWVDAPLG